MDDNLNTVEAYDYLADTWSYMPNMLERRCLHSSVAYKNKLFVIGSRRGDIRETCEVFDSTCNKFVFLKPKPKSMKFSFGNTVQTFSIGSKLITLSNRSHTAVSYDVEKHECSEEPFKIAEDLTHFGCTLVPKQLYIRLNLSNRFLIDGLKKSNFC